MNQSNPGAVKLTLTLRVEAADNEELLAESSRSLVLDAVSSPIGDAATALSGLMRSVFNDGIVSAIADNAAKSIKQEV